MAFKMAKPVDDYDPAWIEWNKQNPKALKAVGADVTGEDGNEGGEESDDTADNNDNSGDTDADNKNKTVDELLAEIEALKQANAGLEDEKAKAVKDAMKKKERARKAEEERGETAKTLEGLSTQLTELFGDEVTLEDLQERIAEKKKNEEELLRKSGEFDELKKRLVSEHKKQVDTLNGKYGADVKALQGKLEAAEANIRKLLVSNSFGASKYISEELTLTPSKAEKLYGEHFKVEDTDNGPVMMAYMGDQPLVDGDGKPKSFDEAMREIIDADDDKELLIRGRAKPGSGSGNENKGNIDASANKTRPSGLEAIRAGLKATSGS